LWMLTISGLPDIIHSIFSDCLAPNGELNAQSRSYRYEVERFVTPLWFLGAMVLWEGAAIAANYLKCKRVLPVVALGLHFVCHTANCPFPFWRDGEIGELHGVLPEFARSLEGNILPAVFSRAVTSWWLFACAPMILPVDFPANLPGQDLVHWLLVRRVSAPRAARMFWITVLIATIAWLSATLQSSMLLPKEVRPYYVRQQSMYLHSTSSYNSTTHRCSTAGCWTLAKFGDDLMGCAVQLTLVIGTCAAMPRGITGVTSAGSASLLFLVVHEYVLAALDYPLASALVLLHQAFGWNRALLCLLSCALLVLAIAWAGQGVVSMLIVLAAHGRSLVRTSTHILSLITSQQLRVVLSSLTSQAAECCCRTESSTAEHVLLLELGSGVDKEDCQVDEAQRLAPTRGRTGGMSLLRQMCCPQKTTITGQSPVKSKMVLVALAVTVVLHPGWLRSAAGWMQTPIVQAPVVGTCSAGKRSRQIRRGNDNNSNSILREWCCPISCDSCHRHVRTCGNSVPLERRSECCPFYKIANGDEALHECGSSKQTGCVVPRPMANIKITDPIAKAPHEVTNRLARQRPHTSRALPKVTKK
jgi:hypothetical protein